MIENLKFVHTIPWRMASESQLDCRKLMKNKGVKWTIGLWIR